MENSLENIIENELEKNSIFKTIFDKFRIPNLGCLDKTLSLTYKSNEYMGYYKKDLYFDLEPNCSNLKCTGTLKLTFISSVKEFDIKKAMHLVSTDETHNVSLTFMLHNEGDEWDTERYNYTLWKNIAS